MLSLNSMITGSVEWLIWDYYVEANQWLECIKAEHLLLVNIR